MRNGRDRRLGRPAYGPREARTREIGWDPIRGLHQGQRPLRLHRDGASLRAKTGRIHGCTRTLRKKSDLLLQRGHRPYMALNRRADPSAFVSGVDCCGRSSTRHVSAMDVGAAKASTIRKMELSMQAITTIGLDLAKSVFQVHGIDAGGQVVIRRQLKRRYVLAFFQKLPPCLIGIEACASSHYWSRELQALGHTVRLMPPAYVKPYVKRQKNDAADAEAICEAVTRPNMRFSVATKTPATAERPGAPSHAPSFHSSADRGNQCDPRPSYRVRHRSADRAQWHRGAAQDSCRSS